MGRLRSTDRRRTAAAWLLACVVSACAGVAAGWQLLGPAPAAGGGEVQRLTYTVQEGSVGRTASYTAHAARERVPLGVVPGGGVITGHGAARGELVEPGAVLLRVDERPVVALLGAVPSYRDLQEGDAGEDVRQLQAYLRDAGHLRAQADGVLGPSTVRAVRAWQRSLGVAPDGVVRAGDVVFTSALPAWVELGDDVGIGARVEAGADLGVAQVGDPAFALVAEEGQRRLPGPGETVTVVVGETRWAAATGTAIADADGRLTVPLAGPDGGPVCADACGLVPLSEGVAVLTAEVVVVPEASGMVVPVAALRTGPGGAVSVELASGAEAAVRVLAADGGLAVVEGLSAGQVLVMFAEEP